VSKGRETIIQAPAPQNLAAEQAAANRITQFSPAGNLFFGEFDAETDQFVPTSGKALRVQETPAQEAIRQLQEIGGVETAAVGAQLAGQLPTDPLTAEGLQERPQFDLSGIRGIPQDIDQSALEQRFADRALSLLQPELERIEDRQAQDLANAGIPIGSEFATDVQDRYGRQRADLLSSLAFDAIRQAEARQADIFGRDMTRRAAERADVTDQISYQNMLREAGLAERQMLRQQAQNELVGLLTGQMLQTPQISNFVQPGQIDVMGPYAMQQQNALARAQLASQDRAATLNALGNLAGGLGSAGILAGSDYRIKDNIEELPDGALDKVNNLQPKTYNYREGYGMDTKPTAGFLAHELQSVIPEYVYGEKDGNTVQLIDVMGVVATLTKAVQELSDKVAKLERNE
jgi:hypothetical protein